MRNKMSFNDVENLKKNIRARMKQLEAVANDVAGQMRQMPQQQMPQIQMQNPQMQNRMQGEVSEFEKYPCGHDYPEMKISENCEERLADGKVRKVDNLRNAFIMSEILSEPMCRKRKNRRRYS